VLVACNAHGDQMRDASLLLHGALSAETDTTRTHLGKGEDLDCLVLVVLVHADLVAARKPDNECSTP
jgi:hypothetical protein